MTQSFEGRLNRRSGFINLSISQLLLLSPCDGLIGDAMHHCNFHDRFPLLIIFNHELKPKIFAMDPATQMSPLHGRRSTIRASPILIGYADSVNFPITIELGAAGKMNPLLSMNKPH